MKNYRSYISKTLPFVAVAAMGFVAACNETTEGPITQDPPVVRIIDPGGDITIAQGATVVFEATGSGGLPPVEYEWDYGDPALEPNFWFGPFGKTFDSPGTYNVTFTGTDGAGKKDTDNVVVTVMPPAPPAVPVSRY